MTTENFSDYHIAVIVAARRVDLFKDIFTASTYLAMVFNKTKEQTMDDLLKERKKMLNVLPREVEE